jgi:coenzyme F420-reducing hydrogenase delta subunit
VGVRADGQREEAVAKEGSGGEQNRRVVLLYCHRVLRQGESVGAAADSSFGLPIQPVAVACGSSVEVSHILKILADGAAAVEVVTCADDCCSSLLGSRRAQRRVEYARQLLGQAGVDPARVGHTLASDATSAEVLELAVSRAKAVFSEMPGVPKGEDQ